MTDLPRRFLYLAAVLALGASQLGELSLVTSLLSGVGGEPAAAEREASDDSRAQDSLQWLTGCFAVRYQFTEDGRGDFFFDDGVEYMDVRERGDGYFVRNYLVYGGETFLHWTQEWTPTRNGRWLLTVRSGDTSLRYRSEGVWRFNQWEGEVAKAEKPTRDGLRTDYDHMRRRNVIQFTDGRWVQSEINMKVRADGASVASELGWITYTRRDSDELCAPAIERAASDR